MEDEEKVDSKIKCPNCDEENMQWDETEKMWQCLSCGYRMEE